MRWLLVLLCWWATPALAELSGKAKFTDADTLLISGVTVRLFGIDAPELDQNCLKADGREWACGQWAADQARALFKGQRLTCTARDTDPYGRTVATCFAGGEDVAEVLVRRGLATAYKRYSGDYLAAEKAAALTLTGIWQGSLMAPEAFRAAKLEARAAANAEAAPSGCVIKGNISERGHIYHLPGQDGYRRTMINEGKGERWFCSEAEALAAGWRKAAG
jgi:endonuclease YncB( thermonuclease family)